MGGFLDETRVFKARGAPSSYQPWVGSDALLPAPGPGNRDPRLMRPRVTQPAGSPGWSHSLPGSGVQALSSRLILGPRSRQAGLPLCCRLLPAPVSACVQEGGSSGVWVQRLFLGAQKPPLSPGDPWAACTATTSLHLALGPAAPTQSCPGQRAWGPLLGSTHWLPGALSLHRAE